MHKGPDGRFARVQFRSNLAKCAAPNDKAPCERPYALTMLMHIGSLGRFLRHRAPFVVGLAVLLLLVQLALQVPDAQKDAADAAVAPDMELGSSIEEGPEQRELPQPQEEAADPIAAWWRTCDARDTKAPPSLTAEDQDFISAGRVTYVEKTGRCPPPGYSRWLLYAKDRQCELHEYRSIERDLLPFRQYFAGRSDVFKRLQAVMAVMTTSDENRRAFHLEHGTIKDGTFRTQTLPGDYLKFISDAVEFLPDAQIFFSNLDEPRVVPGENQLMNREWIAEFDKAYQTLFPANSSTQSPTDEAPTDAQFVDISMNNVSLNPDKAPVWNRIQTNESFKFLFEPHLPFKEHGHRNVLKEVLSEQCPMWINDPRVASEIKVHGAFICPVTCNYITMMVPIFSATKPGGFTRQMDIPKDLAAFEERLAQSEAIADEYEQEGWRVGSVEAPKPRTDTSEQIATENAAGSADANSTSAEAVVEEKNQAATNTGSAAPKLRKRDGAAAEAQKEKTTKKLLPNRNYFSPCFYDILVPDPYNLEHKAPRSLPDVSQMPPWNEKESKVIWRGSTTGGYTSDDGCKEHHRHIGVGKARDLGVKWETARKEGKPAPNITTDVGFTMIALCGNCQYISSKYPTGGHIGFNEHFKSKYLLDIDGNSYSMRFEMFMFGNSIALRAGVHEAWYESFLEPWEHFIPIRMDGSDLEEKLIWLMEHDDFARRIARNAQRHAWRRLRVEDKKCYVSVGVPKGTSRYDRLTDVPRQRLFLEYGYIGDELYYPS